MKESIKKGKMNRTSSGFTLVEVLISIALMGITAVSILGLHSISLQNNIISKEIIESTVITKDIMENIKSQLVNGNYKTSEMIAYYEKKYPESEISIKKDFSKGLYEKGILYEIEIKVFNIRKGSTEIVVSKVYIPNKK
ncbi:type IV pilus modification PilV family protein [Garciella nitratireducens]|nr:prepilin-type N-terminal cleavage/methylation domain-containing protein [Garciella nitratireducens]